MLPSIVEQPDTSQLWAFKFVLGVCEEDPNYRGSWALIDGVGKVELHGMLARIVHQPMYISLKDKTMGRKKKKEGQAADVSLRDLIDKETCWGVPSRLNHHLDSTTRLEKENKVRIYF